MVLRWRRGGSGVLILSLWLQVLLEEALADRAQRLGELLRAELRSLPQDKVEEVRGKGLLNAIVIREEDGVSAWDICLRLKVRQRTNNRATHAAPTFALHAAGEWAPGQADARQHHPPRPAPGDDPGADPRVFRHHPEVLPAGDAQIMKISVLVIRQV